MTHYAIEIFGYVVPEKINELAGWLPDGIDSLTLFLATTQRESDKLLLLTEDIPKQDLSRIKRGIKKIPGMGRRKITVAEVGEERGRLFISCQRQNHGTN